MQQPHPIRTRKLLPFPARHTGSSSSLLCPPATNPVTGFERSQGALFSRQQALHPDLDALACPCRGHAKACPGRWSSPEDGPEAPSRAAEVLEPRAQTLHHHVETSEDAASCPSEVAESALQMLGRQAGSQRC